ncbi:GNAT family N-acetyltransferase [Phenylobacterium deserti]|uniref:N-acetyltransferase n=1 Tax=Phenylobacterium deserti TaxID=1914756 RepID=A0A328AF42_9CAUL|nr:GNAT family N-acetyltransferase [Phenylobacterium deserti]RAK51408.1 N-acetyltransferase [Phenylobacterium deserti]
MSGLVLRPAELEDARRVWLWRNDATARAASRNTGEIDWDAHAAWFPGALARTRMLIAEIDGEAVGMARLDDGPEGCTVSLNLAPEQRGKGLGRRVLEAVCAHAGPLRAEIRADNPASLRIFQACGFVETGRDGDFVQLRRD